MNLINKKGITSLLVLVIMGLLAVSVPVATKLVQNSQDSRSSAMVESDSGLACNLGQRKCKNSSVTCTCIGSAYGNQWSCMSCEQKYPGLSVCNGDGLCKRENSSLSNIPISTVTPTLVETTITDPYLYYSPKRSNNIAIGSTFIVWIRVTSKSQIVSGIDANGIYDSTALELVSAVKSTNMVFGTDGDCVIDKNIAGKFSVNCFVNDNTKVKSVSGNLVRLTFKALKTGVYDVTFDCTQGVNSDSNIVNISQQDIIVCKRNVKGIYTINDGSATSFNTPIPTPTQTLVPTLTTTLNKNVEIYLNPNIKGKIIPSDFLGLVIEKGSICRFVAKYQNNPIMQRLFTNLSPAIFGVGGNSVENVSWVKESENCSNTVVNSNSIDNLFDFASKVNWKITYGLNFKNNTLDNIKNEASYVLSKYNPLLFSLEIGNEPDLYTDWNYTNFKNKWTEYANGIKSLPYQSKIIGPSTAGSISYFNKFINDKNSLISLATFHSYPLGCQSTHPSIVNAMRNSILNTDKLKNTIESRFINYYKNAQKYSLETRLSETNNICPGGTRGVSDTFASTLWATDYIFSVLESGIKGINFHGSYLNTGNKFSPIWTISENTPLATPEYYALLLFKQAASNGYTLPLRINTSLNLAAHAVINNNNKLQLILINKELEKKGIVKVNISKNYKSASALRLTAPSIETTITDPNNSLVKFGGQPVKADGTWSPDQAEEIYLNNNQATILVPPISAVVVTFEP